MGGKKVVEGRKVYARRPYGYNGQELDRGQVFTLVGAKNDGRLEVLGLLAEVPANADLYVCSECGGEFVTEAWRRTHGDKRHPGRVLTDRDMDRLLDREAEILDREEPLRTLDDPAFVVA